jgi:hypothetical protein
MVQCYYVFFKAVKVLVEHQISTAQLMHLEHHKMTFCDHIKNQLTHL